MDDDNKRLAAYGISSGSSVLVGLVAASIWLRIKCPGGDSLTIDDVDLNSLIESLREKAKGDAMCKASEELQLTFKDVRLDWRAPLRSVEQLEDGSELVSQLPLVRIRIIGFNSAVVRLLKVDLNWTVQQVKDKLMGKASNRTEGNDTVKSKVVSTLLRPKVLLCFVEETLEWTTCLRQIKNFASSLFVSTALPPPEGDIDEMGLPNTDLNCYENSVLNSLYFVPQFSAYFSHLSYSAKTGLASLLRRFVKKYGRNKISPQLLREIRTHFPAFRRKTAASSYKFLLSILQGLDEEVQKWADSLQQRFAYYIIIEKHVKCTSCSTETKELEYLRTLSLAMAPIDQCADEETASILSLETCLSAYLSEVRDTDKTPHYCSTCSKDQIHTTQKLVQSIGSAVIIHLQRFHSCDPYAPVDVPLAIDMLQYTQNAGVYTLCSAIRHCGNEFMGHYTCVAKTNKGWRQFNDLEVSLVQLSDYLRSSMLFIYVKSDR